MAKKDTIELDSSEVALLLEAIKAQIKEVEHERFYSHRHPEGFYQIYLERYHIIEQKLNLPVPKVLFVKMPKY